MNYDEEIIRTSPSFKEHDDYEPKRKPGTKIKKDLDHKKEKMAKKASFSKEKGIHFKGKSGEAKFDHKKGIHQEK